MHAYHAVPIPRPCRAPAFLRRYLEKSLSERHGSSTEWAWHGHGKSCVNQTRSHCVNEMGTTQTKSLPTRHDRGAAWARHGHGMGTT